MPIFPLSAGKNHGLIFRRRLTHRAATYIMTKDNSEDGGSSFLCRKEVYHPNPVDASDVSFSPEFDEILEIIAKNVHDTWAQQRIKEGWRWGLNKDDREKTTPLLVPYEELQEEEREYDRITARQTIKQLLMHGYRIVRE